MSDTLNQAQDLLCRVENAADIVGLHTNVSKNEIIAYNSIDDIRLSTKSGTCLEQVQDFQYLGSWVNESENNNKLIIILYTFIRRKIQSQRKCHCAQNDFTLRKALAWNACNKMRPLWKYNLSNTLKSSFFRAAVGSILLYGAEGWTLTKN